MEPIKDNYQLLMEQAEEYSKSANELASIKVEKSTAILILMTENSCKGAELKWSATESGKKETTLTYFLKGLEKRMAALRTKINSERSY